ncbi:MAG: hypothetical protein L3J69_00960 [Desulfobacula sp.]|nr:hypothetical protein [Desulfobacula sp.]
MKKRIYSALIIPFIVLSFSLSCFGAQPPVPKKKQTILNLYITAQQTYAKWQVNPDKIKILDVRTPGEYIFVGHAPMAVNIPLKFLNKSVNLLTMKISMTANENFIEEVRKKFKKTDTIFVMCRSGARSAASVNLMAAAGFKNVYNIIDGFEGGTINIPGSYKNGKRLVNGWKNSGAPWTYALDRSRVYRH